jgi:ABC-type antimicrobial peptide transport system permease subunit
MIRNYFKAALRSLLREKTNTVINIAGLTLGVTGTLVLFLILKNGNSYDKFHSKFDRIYRVVTKSTGNRGDSHTQGVPLALPDAFRNDFSEAEEVAFTSYRRGSLISVVQKDGQLKKFEEPTGVAITQPSFFRIFDRKILIGSAEKGLDDPNESIISKKWALKYFGSEDVIGEIVRYDNMEFKISAVMEDFPANTDFPFELILSYATMKKTMDEAGWGGISDNDNCYFLLKQNESVAKLEQRMPAFVKKYLPEKDESESKTEFLIQPLVKLHSDGRFGNYNKRMPPEAAIAFTVIAIFLLITSCINFINLTTAEAIKRTKEVGIRKVLGSSRTQLVMKYMGETFIITLSAVLISLACTQVALGFLNPFMELSLTLDLRSDFLLLGAVTILVSVLSGLYPAIAVSAFKPVLALKNQISSRTSSGGTMRKSLVVMQFFISQFFIIGTIVITQQMDFIQQYDVGFAKDAIVTIPIPVAENPAGSEGASKMRTLKNEVLRLSGVENASLSGTPPSANSVTSGGVSMVGNKDEFRSQIKQVDGDYLELFAIDVVAGEKFKDADTLTGIMVNEKLVKLTGFASADEIIGKEIDLWGKHVTVTGVVKNFNTTSLEKPIEPVILFSNISDYKKLSIKLKPSDMEATLKEVQMKWAEAYPEYIFSYQFMDEQLLNLYRGDRKISKLLGIFAFIAIFIGCLGLFGLVTFMTNQKTKEVGVRKVLGASVESIMFLFSKEFVKLILIGFALAAPAAGFLMQSVLEEFAYRIDLGPMIFLTSLAATFLIAILTVGYRSFRSATANPINSLRTE